MSAGLLKKRAQALCSSSLVPRPAPRASSSTAFGRCRRRTFASPASPASPAAASSAPEPLRTPLYDLHLAHDAKMVPFAGYFMPLVYPSLKLVDSHHFTRSHASLFDVSHMVQHWFAGPGAAGFLETVCPSRIAALAPMRGGLTTLLLPETGGIVDDAIVTKISDDEFYVVTNGACRDKDIKYFDDQMAAFKTAHGEAENAVQRTSYQAGLLALQGPESAGILQETLADPNMDLNTLHFGSMAWAVVKLVDGTTSSPLLVSRGGYTGEDGFEISLPPSVTLMADARLLVETLLATAGPERLQLAGLGARDSLRLEAGMCLYGHDLDDTVTPVEAGLSWIIAKERRATGGFNGAERILAQLTPRSRGGKGVGTRRVGLALEEGSGPAAREGAVIKSASASDSAGDAAERVGRVTSGMPSPTLGRSIAMGYVDDGLHRAGTEVAILVRGKPRKAVVTKMPFVPTRYFRGVAAS